MNTGREDLSFYRAICAALPLAAAVVDGAGTVLFHSKAFTELCEDEDAEAFLSRLWTQLDRKTDPITEKEVVLSGGGDRSRRFLADVRALEVGENLRLMTLREVTARQKRLQQLEAENILFAKASRVGRIGAWKIDLGTGRVTWTEEVYRINEVGFSYTPTLERAFDFFIKEDRERLRYEFGRARQTGKRFSIDLRLHTPLENYYWVRVVGQAEFEDGEAVRAIGIIEDITLLKWQHIDLTEQLQRKANELYQKNRFLQKTKELVVESEKKYRHLADKAPFAIALINDADFLYSNPRWQELTGYGMAANREVHRFVDAHPQLRTMLRPKNREQYNDQGLLHHSNLHLEDPSGVGRWVDFSTVPTDYRGRRAMLLFAYDITDKRSSELEVKYSHERFRYIVKHDPSAIAVFDGGMNYLFVSDRYLSDYKVSADDIIGRSHYEVFPEVPERWRHIHRQVLDGTVRRCDEDRFPRQDGSHDYIMWECRPWYDREANIGGLVMYTEVITERKKAEIALRHNEARLRQLMDSTVEAIVGLDVCGMCIFINRSGLELLGYGDDSEVIGKQMHELCHHSHVDGSPYPIDDCPIVHALENRSSMTSSDMTFWKRDNTSFPVSLRMQAVSGDGQAQGGVLTFLDISSQIKASHEKKRLEEQLQQSQKMEAIGTLAGGIAHDFNNILGAIIGYAELVEIFGTDSPEETEDRFKQIAKAAYRARDLVNQILTFSRKEEENFEVVHCCVAIEEVFTLMRASLPASVVMNTVFETENDRIYGNRTEIVRMLINLCTNAADSMRSLGGTLTVRVGETDEVPEDLANPEGEGAGWLFLEVCDSGPGFPAALAERIFDPYFTTKKQGEGTGMGLAIVYGIVTAHHGRIQVRSKEGQGSVFRIFLPRTEKRSGLPLSNKEEASPAVVPRDSSTILLVDDEKDLLGPTGEALDRLGYSVTSTDSATEAMKLFSLDPAGYDLLITDYNMPQMMGTELIAKVHAVDPGVRVILCTGNIHMVSLERLEKLNIAEVLGKPVSLPALLAAVERTVKKRE